MSHFSHSSTANQKQTKRPKQRIKNPFPLLERLKASKNFQFAVLTKLWVGRDASFCSENCVNDYVKLCDTFLVILDKCFREVCGEGCGHNLIFFLKSVNDKRIPSTFMVTDMNEMVTL